MLIVFPLMLLCWIFKWIETFLKNRKQRIVQGKVVSSWADILSGVPQSSVLGPLLFVIYINDLPKRIKSLTKLYADDTKILSVINSEECRGKIQADLDNAFKWTQEWLLKFSIDKCLVMHYGFNNKKYPLYINGRQLVESDLERDLGIMFSTSLKWKNQEITAKNRANQMLGRIKKSYALFDCKLMRSLYLTFIRPYLEFAVSV
jgi:ribonuclease P/MRP protein subunit RPP40